MEMKMSDVFELPVSRDGFKLKDKCGISEEMHVAKFADLSACVYAEFAINNHDRLVKENAELRAFISEVGGLDMVEAKDRPFVFTRITNEAKQLLNKNKV